MKQDSSRVMLITGAAGALGSALAAQAIERGYDCVLLDRDRRGLERLHDRLAQEGPAPAFHPMDLAGAGPDDHASLAEALEGEFGRLDVLVHAAADFIGLKELEQHSPGEWMKVLQAGLTGPFLLTQALLPLLRRPQPAGRVVWVIDDPAERSRAYWGAYGVSQAARRALASIFQAECRTRGPEMLIFEPGPFRSTLRRRAWPAEDSSALPGAGQVAGELLDRLSESGPG